MGSELPEIALAFGDGGWPVVFADETECANVADLLAHAPGLLSPSHATLCAQAVNHLAHEQTYKVIEDPEVFATWYQKRREEEDPDVDWELGKHQLTNFEMPALEQIRAPSIGLQGLEFFAVNRAIGAPYRVTSTLDAEALAELDYVPLGPTEDDTAE